MTLVHRLLGRHDAPAGTTPSTLEDLQRALLARDRPELPYRVRHGAADGVDLVAEWRLDQPAWHAVLERSQVDRALRLLMRLDAARHEVRTRDELWTVTWTQGVPRLSVEATSQRGLTVNRAGRVSSAVADPHTWRFSSEELKAPLRETVLAHGWGWRPVVLGSLRR